MRIMIVDDHELVREGVRSALSRVAGIEVVAEASTGREALRRDLRGKLGREFLHDDSAGQPGTGQEAVKRPRAIAARRGKWAGVIRVSR